MGTLAPEIPFLFQFTDKPDPWRKISIHTISLISLPQIPFGLSARGGVFF